jgi:hypothetical protein
MVMSLSIYPRTDGAYLIFEDPEGRRFILERELAAAIFDRLQAHLGMEPDPTLLNNTRAIGDRTRDWVVLEIYYQDCENFFEISTKTGPVLQATATEVGTMLWVARRDLAPVNRPRPLTILPFTLDSVPIVFAASDHANGISYG